MSQPTNYDVSSSQSKEIPFARQVVTIRPITRLKIKEKPFAFLPLMTEVGFFCKKKSENIKKEKKGIVLTPDRGKKGFKCRNKETNEKFVQADLIVCLATLSSL
jgi:hypothetical protein